MYACLSHRCAEAQGDQKREWDLLVLELQVTASCPTWVLGLSPLEDNPATVTAEPSSGLRMLISIYVACKSKHHQQRKFTPGHLSGHWLPIAGTPHVTADSKAELSAHPNA